MVRPSRRWDGLTCGDGGFECWPNSCAYAQLAGLNEAEDKEAVTGHGERQRHVPGDPPAQEEPTGAFSQEERRHHVEKSPEQSDEIQSAYERDLTIRNPDRESNLLRKVAAALLRIDDGDFGTCVWREEMIGTKRLTALPWAPCCLRCQVAAEHDQSGTGNAAPLLDGD
jgi:RNA polymerase-binding protein DksA